MTALNYNELAAEYVRNRRTNSGVLESLIAGGHIGTTSRVLEVGCGTGNYAGSIHAMTGCPVTGLDPSVVMLDFARAQNPGLTLVEGRAEALPFADESFDFVYSVDVIHHVIDRDAFFREAARVLVPGGSSCTVTDSASDIRSRAPLAVYFPETIAVELERYPDIETLKQEMRSAGFDNIEQTTTEITGEITNSNAYRERANSSLHLIDEAAWAAGLARLESDLDRGPIATRSLYTLVWGTVPEKT